MNLLSIATNVKNRVQQHGCTSRTDEHEFVYSIISFLFTL